MKTNIWMCKNCDYSFDEQEGDVEAGIKPGVRYEDLPSDWNCPDCSGGKNEFVKKDAFVMPSGHQKEESVLWK